MNLISGGNLGGAPLSWSLSECCGRVGQGWHLKLHWPPSSSILISLYMVVVKLRRSLPIYFSRKGTAWRGPTIAHPLSILSCWTVGMGRCGKYDETHFNSTNTGIWQTGLGWACDEASRVGDAILYQFIKHIVIKLWCLLIWFQVRDTQPGVYLHLPPLEVNIN